MAQGSLSNRLSAQDASFLYFEKEEAPLHIGSIGVFEGDVPYDKFVANVAAKMHLIPRYMQRVIPAPFNIGHPSWEWDPNFDLSNHLMTAEIESPGSHEQLMDLAAKLFADKLDRTKPLWEMYLVRGLEGDRSALISKVHHCLVDGVSGIELLMIVLDVSAEPAPTQKQELPERPQIPGPVRLFADAALDTAAQRLDRLADQQSTFIDWITTGADRTRSIGRAIETTRPYMTVPVVRAPFNQPLRKERRLAVSEFSFAEIRAIRQSVGGTVNDVCLAILGGAVGRYLEMHQQTTENRSFRVLTPVNVRREDEQGALGNRVSMLLVEVPVGVRDPVERLKIINARTTSLKERNVADGINVFSEMSADVPPMIQAFMGTLPTPPNTLANMVCTNVPGPMIPLFTVGHRLVAHYPMVPLGWEMGVGCGVTSYNQKLYFGLMADANSAPDITRMKEFLDQAYVELRSAAGVAKSDIPQMGVAPETSERPRRAAGQHADSMAADAG